MRCGEVDLERHARALRAPCRRGTPCQYPLSSCARRVADDARGPPVAHSDRRQRDVRVSQSPRSQFFARPASRCTRRLDWPRAPYRLPSARCASDSSHPRAASRCAVPREPPTAVVGPVAFPNTLVRTAEVHMQPPTGRLVLPDIPTDRLVTYDERSMSSIV